MASRLVNAGLRQPRFASNFDAQASGASTPGGDWGKDDANAEQGRIRPRTYPYFEYLPYDVEEESERNEALNNILKNLYICIEAGDFAPGALHWTRELRAWMALKFDLPRSMRVRLVKLYYELSLAPGVDPSVAERFAGLYTVLMKYLSPTPGFVVSLLILTTLYSLFFPLSALEFYTHVQHTYNIQWFS